MITTGNGPLTPSLRVWLILAVCLAVIAGGQLFQVSRVRCDFASFYFAAKLAAQNGNLYDLDALNALVREFGIERNIFPYLYPPVLACLWRPLAGMSLLTAQAVWTWLSFILLLVSAAAAVGWVSSPSLASEADGKGRSTRWGVATVMVALLMVILPFRGNLVLGQINPLVLAAMVGFLALFFSGRATFLAGCLLSLAVAIKVTPVVFLLPVVRRRGFSALGGFVIGGAVLAALTLVAGGVRQWPRFLGFLPATGYGKTIPGLFSASHVWNISVAGLFARLFPGSEPMVGWLTTAVVLCLAAVVCGSYLVARDQAGMRLLLLPLSVVMIVAAPYAYGHHVIYLLPGLLCAMCHVWSDYPRAARGALVVAMSGLAFAGRIDLTRVYERFLDPAQLGRGAITSVSLYALLGLYVVGLGLFWQHHATREASPVGRGVRHAAEDPLAC